MDDVTMPDRGTPTPTLMGLLMAAKERNTVLMRQMAETGMKPDLAQLVKTRMDALVITLREANVLDEETELRFLLRWEMDTTARLEKGVENVRGARLKARLKLPGRD